MTHLCSSSCICRLLRACILRETSTKPLGMLTHLLIALFPSLDRPVSISLSPSADCVLLSTALSSRLFSSVLVCQLLSLSSLGPSFPPPLPVSREIAPKQRDSLTGANTNGNEYNLLCHTKLICLHIVKWFQVLLPNTNIFICTHVNSCKDCYLTLVILFNIIHSFAHS